MTTRTNIPGGSPREPILGYSRAVKIGDQVLVSGTTSGGVGDTAEEQTREIFNRIEKALAKAGASLSDVVRTTVYLTNIDRDFDEVGAVHGELFGDVLPTNTVVGSSALASPELLVEISVDAVIGLTTES
ncbi:enamine deaminase RidA (YjgF/YER057c/UK114 family) [Curtobacterium pusillum]|uniref:Enamine deaminase RidA (YjgF/YER057c/UK114 family) n=1 Tax=Curtobacterium pusillum TaxID=69373 RepID=A0AAW3T6G7_9MICO|nr:RidA family protein [Curtobacterium pusillum]MBA8990764.1 enamine deaminase RidA (YjgF/YER057c/UK114 family) [Curtobacterium pusillum]